LQYPDIAIIHLFLILSFFYLTQGSFLAAQNMQCYHPSVFGGIIGGLRTRQGILQPVSFVFGIADVMVGHQIDAIQARLAPMQAGNSFQVRTGIGTIRDERAAQPKGGTQPGQEIQVGGDQIVRYGG